MHHSLTWNFQLVMQERGKEIVPTNAHLQEGTQQNTVHQDTLDSAALFIMVAGLVMCTVDCFVVPWVFLVTSWLLIPELNFWRNS